MAKVNVYVKDSEQEYRLLEHYPRNEAVEKLQQVLLKDGIVPEWVESVKFYLCDGSHGDHPVEVYEAGDSIECRTRGRPALDKATRAYTLDKEIAAFLDKLPEGARSRFVNECLRHHPQIIEKLAAEE